MLTIRAAIEAAAQPEAIIDGVYAATDAEGRINPEFMAMFPDLNDKLPNGVTFDDYPHEDVELLAVGHFTAKRYTREDGWYAVDPLTGAASVTGTEELQFLITIPKANPARGVAPPYPVVIFQHAFSVCKETVIGLHGMLSRYGFATIGIDAVGHGSRYPGGWRCDLENAAFIGGMGDPQTGAALFRDTVIELFQLVRLVRAMDLDLAPLPGGDGVPDLDADRLSYVGQSMGSFMGAIFASVEPYLHAAVFNVGGAGFPYLILGTMSGSDGPPADYGDMIDTVGTLLLGIHTVMEDADAANYAHMLVRAPALIGAVQAMPRNVLLQQAVPDEVVPYTTTHILTRIAGLDLLTPAFSPIPDAAEAASPVRGNRGDVTAVVAQFHPARHDFMLVLRPTAEDPDMIWRAQEQAAIFLRTAHDTGTGTVVDPYDAAQMLEFGVE